MTIGELVGGSGHVFLLRSVLKALTLGRRSIGVLKQRMVKLKNQQSQIWQRRRSGHLADQVIRDDLERSAPVALTKVP